MAITIYHGDPILQIYKANSLAVTKPYQFDFYYTDTKEGNICGNIKICIYDQYLGDLFKITMRVVLETNDPAICNDPKKVEATLDIYKDDLYNIILSGLGSRIPHKFHSYRFEFCFTYPLYKFDDFKSWAKVQLSS